MSPRSLKRKKKQKISQRKRRRNQWMKYHTFIWMVFPSILSKMPVGGSLMWRGTLILSWISEKALQCNEIIKYIKDYELMMIVTDIVPLLCVACQRIHSEPAWEDHWSRIFWFHEGLCSREVIWVLSQGDQWVFEKTSSFFHWLISFQGWSC